MAIELKLRWTLWFYCGRIWIPMKFQLSEYKSYDFFPNCHICIMWCVYGKSLRCLCRIQYQWYISCLTNATTLWKFQFISFSLTIFPNCHICIMWCVYVNSSRCSFRIQYHWIDIYTSCDVYLSILYVVRFGYNISDIYHV